ncbi:hypothetical protein jhhlp_002012 [Lomentospora prolificans]|uniref:Polyprenal reductase n=1 Tax=Lomentospora prolificans TaxID=41688 RepID=A0A2N3ND31_9PEZI|nr:hypothetical protein jhhlp_002012 [Lomentospora prolificans]
MMASQILDHVSPALQPLFSLAPSQYCQAYFGILGLGCVTLQIFPSLQDALLGYGARKADKDANPEDDTGTNLFVKLLGKLGMLTRVPHSWFAHFYIALLCFQVFWLAQLVTNGGVMRAIAESEVAHGGGKGMEFGQIVLAWGMVTMQGARRLYECLVVMKPSTSPMLALHWVLSFLVYVALSISVWVEGSETILHTSLENADVAPPFWTLFPLVSFSMASKQQQEAHKHLASLKKYTLPTAGLFRYLTCPHYTCECIIYVTLATVAAPRGSTFNPTLIAALFFVVSNLGATARSTKKWYIEKFGREKVPRWSMIPFFFQTDTRLTLVTSGFEKILAPKEIPVCDRPSREVDVLSGVGNAV